MELKEGEDSKLGDLGGWTDLGTWNLDPALSTWLTSGGCEPHPPGLKTR